MRPTRPLYHDVIAEVEAADEGPQIGAFFDFDGTLIFGYSAFAFLREQLARGDLNPADLAQLLQALLRHGMGNLDFSSMMVLTAQFMAGYTEQGFNDLGEDIFRKHLAKLVYPEARALVQAHQRKGHTVAIISSATPYQVHAAARDLGIKHVRTSELLVVDGTLTGEVVRPTCYGPGKVRAAEEIAAATGVDLAQSWFYSDGAEDLPLLERVGHPRPLNPDRRLAPIARERNWPVRRFASRGFPSPFDIARSLAATGSVITAAMAALPIYALTRDLRKSRNFSMQVFAETASALAGLELEVQGEHHLWQQRPAVFVFNHQSKADVLVVAQLLRRDIAGVGKKEIRNIPVIGQIFELGGTVLIDRANAGSAIEAMQPLVDVMRDEGRSVVLAPEGTRTVSPTLAPFKKGAFHLAMQAGVPMVPMVIHNALDMAPKGDFIFHPATIRVTVLPPVDTSAWRRDTINDHVAEVRGMFQDTLGQPRDA